MKLDVSAFLADPKLIVALGPHGTPVDCDGERQLFCQGDLPTGIYIFEGGEVVLSMRSTDGSPLLSGKALPGSILGLPAVIGNVEYSLSAVARGGSRVSFVSRETATQLMLSEPVLSMMILKVLAAEVRTARIALTRNRD